MTKPGSGFARKVTLANLNDFKPLLRHKGEPSAEELADDSNSSTNSAATSAAVDTALLAAEALFAGKSIAVKTPPAHPGIGSIVAKKQRGAVPGGGTPSVVQIIAPSPPVAMKAKGTLRWQKVLTRTDAQRQTGHVTGDLRLTQAKFKVAGKSIDQTAYFRHTIFASGTWAVESTNPIVEVSSFEFDVTILNKHYGNHVLTVSHKPTGEAAQGNYTTGIRWGDLLTILQNETDVGGGNFASLRTTRQREFAIFH